MSAGAPPPAGTAPPKPGEEAATESNGKASAEIRGPWNERQGPWNQGQWAFIKDPVEHVRQTLGLADQEIVGSTLTMDDVEDIDTELAHMRSIEVKVPRRKKEPMTN